jgi:hypothetical protein
MQQGWEHGQKRWKKDDQDHLSYPAPQAEVDDVLILKSEHSVCNLGVEHIVFTPVSAVLSSEPEPDIIVS